MKVISFKGGIDRNLSYLIYDIKTKKAIVIDPFKNINIYFSKEKELGLKIIGILNTHYHRDHIEGNAEFIEKNIKILDTTKKTITLGNLTIKLIASPGHSQDSVCILAENNLFTGDVLFVNRAGMSQVGEPTKQLYESLKTLKKLPGKTKIYPGHHYNSPYPSTISKEKKNNKYLKAKTLEEFEKVMNKWRDYTLEYYRKKRKTTKVKPK